MSSGEQGTVSVERKDASLVKIRLRDVLANMSSDLNCR